ncbi:hypothetical protein JAAARDRAFT_200649 [Jaapia argillacea MUCL 33604]|uniref:Uncharacterized protein n=1 Tax=Jaapia argillacea MUCL 33604 TaxID=933084 RepID=A0A067PF32_9AGAM|nr:hypothetical protein JAAARDRAFT_200649 [Jaapia argillacea MUCL 33604]
MNTPRNAGLSFTVPLENLTESTNLFRTVSADVEVESVSDATVSDVAGPGRTAGTWISKAGRGVERLVDQVATKVVASKKRRRPHPAPQSMITPPLLMSPGSHSTTSFTVSPDDIPALAEMFTSASVDIEALSESDGSLSDQMGPGRTFGKWLSQSGGKLKQVMGGAAERLGLGPNAVMAEILSRANHYALKRKYDLGPRSLLPLRSPRPFSTLLLETVGKEDLESGVLMVDPKLMDGYRKLVDLLRDNNHSNRLLAIYYIVALTCAFLDSQALFLDLGALGIIQDIYTYSTMLPLRHRDRDLLLAPSRRALVLLSESHILASIKEYYQVPWYPPPANRVHLAHLVSVLLPYTITPDSQLLAIQRLAVMPLGDNISVVVDQLTPEIMFQWFMHSLSMDPFERSVFLTFIHQLLKQTFTRPPNNMWHWRCFLLPACQVYMRHPQAALGDGSIATELLRIYSDPQSSRFAAYLAATLTNEARTSLQQLFHSRSNDRQWLSIISQYGSPFFALWGAWNRHWYFRRSGAAHGAMCIRAVPSTKQTRLCEELVKLILQDQCSADDVARVLEADNDCFHEILRLLNNDIQSDTRELRYRVEAKALSQKLVAWNERHLPKLEKKETIIYRGVCVRDGFYPNSTGCLKVFTAPSGDTFEDLDTRKGQYSTTEVLYADGRLMRWVSPREIKRLHPRYRPIVVNDGQDTEQEFIGCVSAPHVLHIFSVGKSWDMPDELSVGDLHVLAYRLTDDGSVPFHWRR